MGTHKLDGVLIWIIRLETKYGVAVGIQHDSVPSHRHLRKRSAAIVGAGFPLGSSDCLKIVAMEVEWMSAFIIIVDNDLNNFIPSQYKSIGVGSIYIAVGGDRTGRHGRVQCRHLRSNIRYIIEESTVTIISNYTGLGYIYISRLTSSHHHPDFPSLHRA